MSSERVNVYSGKKGQDKTCCWELASTTSFNWWCSTGSIVQLSQSVISRFLYSMPSMKCFSIERQTFFLLFRASVVIGSAIGSLKSFLRRISGGNWSVMEYLDPFSSQPFAMIENFIFKSTVLATIGLCCPALALPMRWTIEKRISSALFNLIFSSSLRKDLASSLLCW